MTRVCFICLGNICRSTMAEFLFKKLVQDKNIADEFFIESRATSFEAVGWGVHRGTAEVLNSLGIDCSEKHSVQLEKADSDKYDYFICMDESNVANTRKILNADCSRKIIKILNLTEEKRDVADPYYTGDFQATYHDLTMGLDAFLKYLEK